MVQLLGRRVCREVVVGVVKGEASFGVVTTKPQGGSDVYPFKPSCSRLMDTPPRTQSGLVVIRVDGSCLPRNPNGIASYGFVIEVEGVRVKEGYGVVGHENVSNNVAEYTALIRALQWLRGSGIRPGKVVVKSDSQLLIRQLKGQYSVRSPRLIPLYVKVKELVEGLPIEYQWIPRSENKDADSLSRRAYEEYLQEHPNLAERYKR